jgi:hypothetical protein
MEDLCIEEAVLPEELVHFWLLDGEEHPFRSARQFAIDWNRN